MLKGQNNVCLISKQNTSLVIDHDHNHDTRNVRGLLCHLCNTGIGCFKEKTQYLKDVIKYIEKHNVNT